MKKKNFCLWVVCYPHGNQFFHFLSFLDLLHPTCWQSFRWYNLTITWQYRWFYWCDSRIQNDQEKCHNLSLSKIINTFSSNALPLTSQGITMIFKYSYLENWALSQYCHCMLTNMLGNKHLMLFVAANSELSLRKASVNSRSSSRTLLFHCFIHLVSASKMK